jgi:hypothetical protein
MDIFDLLIFRFFRDDNVFQVGRGDSTKLVFNGHSYNISLGSGKKVADADKYNVLWKCYKTKSASCGGREWTSADGFYVTETQKHTENCQNVE